MPVFFLAFFFPGTQIATGPEGVVCLAQTQAEGFLAILEEACLEETAEADYSATVVGGSLAKTLAEDSLGKTVEEVYSEILAVAFLVKVVAAAYLEPTAVEGCLATRVVECLEAPAAVCLAVEVACSDRVVAGSLASPVEDYLEQAPAASERQVAYLEIQEVGFLVALKVDLVEVSSEGVECNLLVEVSLELLLVQCHQAIPTGWVV